MGDRSMKKILGATRRAVEDYHMIEDGDRICVGISGGKDSMLTLFSLDALSKFYPKKFTVFGVTVDMGLGSDYTPVADFLAEKGIEYHIKETRIADIVFKERKESNPCSLCANLRRGALYISAKEYGACKVALGHHFDDTVETFMLNLIFEGRLGCFKPVTYLDRSGLTVIRPLIYLHERDVTGFVAKNSIPVVKSDCPANGKTQRQSVKELLENLGKDYPEINERIFGALRKSGIDGWGTGDIQLKSRKIFDNDETE